MALAGETAFLSAETDEDDAAFILESTEMNLLVLAGDGIGPEDRTGHIARTPSRLRAMTMRWISLVPSPISVSFASRR